jgi:hypothetical protein
VSVVPLAQVDRLVATAERCGRVINAVGVPLMLMLFTGVYFGWVPSPLYLAVHQNQEMLLEHGRLSRATAEAQAARDTDLARALVRLTEVLKMIDCGDIKDERLRERCLQR